MGNSPSTTAQDPSSPSPSSGTRHEAPPSAPIPTRHRGPQRSNRSLLPTTRYSDLADSWRRQAARSSTDTPLTRLSTDNIGDRPYESDDRPLVDAAAAYDHHAVPLHSPRPSNWRYSTMSRLGSRLLPDTVAQGLLSSGEETAEEGQALRQGLLSRSRPSVYHRRIPSTNNNDRFSLTGSFRRRMEPRPEPSRRSVRGLFNLTSEHQQLHNDTPPPLDDDDDDDDEEEEENMDNDLQMLTTDTARLRRSPTRLRRIRNSLSVSLTNLLRPTNHDRTGSPSGIASPPLRSSHGVLTDDSDELLSQPNLSDLRPEADEMPPHELDATEPESRNLLSTSRLTSGMSTIRRFPHGLRSRSTRLIRRGEHPPLSQVLQLAAAAIAAQLSGASDNSAEGTRPVPSPALDGSIQNFVQTLQDAASAQAGENIDLNATEGDLPPVNFMRVFQFPNDENGTPMASHGSSRTELNDNTFSPDPDRSVTLVLVGVRSMPNVVEGSQSDSGAIGPSLDTLLSLPFLPPANVLRNGSSGALFRRSDTRLRQNIRRHSMTNFNFPQQYESQRHNRTRTPGRRASTDHGHLTPSHSSTTPLSESPPGPHPPPSTPADIRSGHATPNRRPSSASAAHVAPPLPNVNEDQPQDEGPPAADAPLNVARHRRRSDSEFARRPELSSGNSRRNGMVEPDRPSTGGGRSWLIYVVGTNVSPDHPAFTMPSLFTDNPSYEDMQMLSTLLGPVKPPVASREDVASAGGLFRLVATTNGYSAEPLSNTTSPAFTIRPADRCLICLCEYAAAEEVRQIDTCQHLYHKECIDEWLITGRNSCPMCRGQGVRETGGPPRDVTQGSTAPTAA